MKNKKKKKKKRRIPLWFYFYIVIFLGLVVYGGIRMVDDPKMDIYRVRLKNVQTGSLKTIFMQDSCFVPEIGDFIGGETEKYQKDGVMWSNSTEKYVVLKVQKVKRGD